MTRLPVILSNGVQADGAYVESALDPNAVSGPASAIDGNVAVFDGTSGKLIKDGGAVPSDPGSGFISWQIAHIQLNHSSILNLSSGVPVMSSPAAPYIVRGIQLKAVLAGDYTGITNDAFLGFAPDGMFNTFGVKNVSPSDLSLNQFLGNAGGWGTLPRWLVLRPGLQTIFSLAPTSFYINSPGTPTLNYFSSGSLSGGNSANVIDVYLDWGLIL